MSTTQNDTAVVKYDGPKHTPGPWAFDKDTVWTNANLQSNIICDRPRYKFNGSGKNWNADARLIAAAPDMLAALQEIYSAAANNTHLIPEKVAECARAAISKATGEA